MLYNITNVFGRSFAGVFLLCIIIIGASLHVHAEENATVSMEVTYGYGETTKMGTNTPFHISVTNNGSEINGRVEILLSSFKDSSSSNGTFLNNSYKEKNYMYEKSQFLSANATTNVSMVLPLMSRNNKLKITVFDEYGDPVCEQKLDIEAEDYSYYVYAAVLSDEASVINYFQNTAIYQYNDYTFKGILLNK